MHSGTVFANLILVLTLSAAVITGPAAVAQKKQPSGTDGPKYDLQTETKIKGTIEEVKPLSKGSEKEIVHVQVSADANTLDVYLCPKTFLDDMGMTFAKGDAVVMTGSKAKQGDTEVFLAREIVKGNGSYVLRDAKGEPVWDWHH